MAKAACFTAGILIALVVLSFAADGHEWYNEEDGRYDCCNDQDCRPALPGEITWTPLGWLVVLVDEKHQAETIQFDWEHIHLPQPRQPSAHLQAA